jgi:ligand-binding sensor domain-containing protein/signal transduction histidine kinase
MRLVSLGAVFLLAGALSPLAAGEARAPGGVFRHLAIEEGLSDTHLRSIVQDRDGFLWFGTVDGLNRYDGYQIRIFRHEPGEASSLGSSFVHTLSVDRSGSLWVGTIGGGLNRYDPLTEGFVRYQHDPADPESLGSNEIHSIWDDGNGALWIGTAMGLDRMDLSSGRFRHYRHDPDDPESLSHDDVFTLIQDRRGSLWVGTAGGLNRLVESTDRARFSRFPHDARDPHGLSRDAVNAVHEEGEDALWVGTWGGGLAKLDPLTGRVTRYEERGLPGSFIWSVFGDRQGRLWVGAADGGLSLLDRSSDSFRSYRHDPHNPSSLSHDNVVTLHEDREGLLWVGTGGGGVNVLDPNRKPFSTLLLSPGPSRASSLDVRAIEEDVTGTLWVGTFGDGLYAVDDEHQSTSHYRHEPGNPRSLSDDVVLSVEVGTSGVLWFGTSKGLNRFDRATGRFRRYDRDTGDPASFGESVVLSVLEDQERGGVWVGTSNGLEHLDLRTGDFTRHTNPDGRESDQVYAIRQDGKGDLWLARSIGLDRFDPETGRFHHHPLATEPGSSESSVWAIHRDESGGLWLGTSNGLLSFDPDSGSFVRHNDRSGPPLGTVAAILEDDRGGLWLGRTRGLSRFDLRTKTFRHYDSEETDRRLSFGTGAMKSRTGRLFFGAGDGLLAFDPAEIRDSSYVPPVVLTGLQVSHRTVPIGEDSILKRSITRAEALVLPARERVLSFEFASLSYRAPKKNRYRYRLDGFDSEWTEVDSGNRRATYTNLPPGPYVFRVTGSNNDGIWNEEGAALRLQVLPFWWQSWWFRALGLLALALALFAAHRLRLRAVEKRAAELQREVAAREMAEGALREREERNRSVLESLKSHIALLDHDGRITAVNESWSSFVGAKVGVDYTGLLRRAAGEGDEKARDAVSGIESVLQGSRETFDLEYRHPSPTGILWSLMTVVPFRGHQGGAVVSLTDVTDRRRALDEAQKRREELAHVARVATVGELTASIAHEINQPLASIVTYANAGRRFLDSGSSAQDDVRSILRAIAEQGKRAGDIILHLRELLGKGRVERASLDVNELLRAVLALVHGDALQKGVSLNDSLTPGLPPIPGHAIELQQVILNLVMNGFEAMSQGDNGPRELRFRTWSEGGRTVEIALSDTGPPIAEETFSKMFQRFYTSKPAGLGIGLSICQTIVEAHGGRLWAERNPERGLTMRVSLPARDAT